MATNEEVLRSRGYAPGLDGQWHKAVPGAENPPSRADRKRVAKRPLEDRPQVEKPPACRFLAIVTVRSVASRDYDGLGPASKGYLDCLADTGLFPDDDPDSFEVVFDSQKVLHYPEEETVIELFMLPNSQDHPPEGSA
jgi:hypothetical protein